MELPSNFENMFKGIYGWTTSGDKAVAPVHKFPREVKERADYFAEMAEDGLTFLGVVECIFAEEKPTDYDLGATKPWLPMTETFTEWVGYLHNMAQMEMIVYLLYGYSGSVGAEEVVND
ncbi:hypothetical protein [Streptococcus hyointestinalis]|uniref:hypothetical protein n=1 Tax=Streptococcus hyointestinalis TaxID=1337 RepID=UPI0013E0244D|nr:hypothetical protein [Streptococcus hyointestinalis]